MASNQTANYQLNQWGTEDKVLRTDFNADNLKIDGALAEEAAARGALAEVVAEQAAAIAKLGNCKIVYGTYTGVGIYGDDNPIQLSFPFEPKLVIVQNTAGAATDTRTGQLIRSMMILVRPQQAYYLNEGVETISISWSDNTVSWYSTSSLLQFNSKNHVYIYMAIGLACEKHPRAEARGCLAFKTSVR